MSVREYICISKRVRMVRLTYEPGDLVAARAAGILALTNMLLKGEEMQCFYVAVNFGDEDGVGAKTGQITPWLGC